MVMKMKMKMKMEMGYQIDDGADFPCLPWPSGVCFYDLLF